MSHGIDLPLDTIEATKSGAVAPYVEVVRDRRKPSEELRVDCQRPFDHALADRLVDFTRLELNVRFRHLVVPSIRLIFRFGCRERSVPPIGFPVH